MNDRWLVCGGRDFRDFRFLVDTLDALLAKRGRPDVLISGGQRTRISQKEYIGADHYAEEWARFNGIPFMVFPIADFQWKAAVGKSAGPARNSQMILFGRPTHTVAFEGGPGTANMVKQSRKAKIKVIEPKRDTNAQS